MEYDWLEEEKGLWARLVKGLSRASRWQFVIKIVLILGGTLTSVIGGAMEGPLSPAEGPGVVTLKGLLVFLGGGAAAIGGGLLLWADWDTPELLDAAKRYISQVRVYLDERDELLKLDDKRRSLLELQKTIYEACEAIPRDTDIEHVLAAMVAPIDVEFRTSIGFENNERWALSIFRLVEQDGNEVMKRVVTLWAERGREANEGRCWGPKEGFTGWAWHEGREIIVSDARAVEHSRKFDAPGEKQKPLDAERYVSAAAIPIQVGAEDRVWGVVTATSDMPGRFKSNPTDVRSQNVETVRVLARLIASQVALRVG